MSKQVCLSSGDFLYRFAITRMFVCSTHVKISSRVVLSFGGSILKGGAAGISPERGMPRIRSFTKSLSGAPVI